MPCGGTSVQAGSSRHRPRLVHHCASRVRQRRCNRLGKLWHRRTPLRLWLLTQGQHASSRCRLSSQPQRPRRRFRSSVPQSQPALTTSMPGIAATRSRPRPLPRRRPNRDRLEPPRMPMRLAFGPLPPGRRIRRSRRLRARQRGRHRKRFSHHPRLHIPTSPRNTSVTSIPTTPTVSRPWVRQSAWTGIDSRRFLASRDRDAGGDVSVGSRSVQAGVIA